MPRQRTRGLDAIVVGAGLMGRWHAYEIERIGGRVVAVVDPDLERARQLARRYGGAAAADLGVLDDTRSARGRTVVHVCTPSGTHEPLIERALHGGRHVLVEKPLASNSDATTRLLGEARERGLLLGAVHQFPFQSGVRKLLRERDRLGEILHLMGEARSAGAEGRSDADRNRVAVEIVPHFLSLACRFLPDGLEGIHWQVARPRPGELSVTGGARGVEIHLLVSMGGRPPVNLWAVMGTRATGRADLFHGHAWIETGGTSRASKVARPFLHGGLGLTHAAINLLGRTVRRQPAYPGLRELVRSFHDAAATGVENPVPEDEIVDVARALDTIASQ
jgi:predicted dehydrogenase